MYNPECLNNYDAIVEMQNANYSKRIGQVFGNWEVIKVEYDWELRKQIWTLKCRKCEIEKVTKNHRDLVKGRTTGCYNCRQNSRLKIVEPEVEKISYIDESYLGKIYGTEKVVGFNKKLWICECQLCHNTHLRSPLQLINGSAPKCICNSLKYDESWVGRRFERLEIIEYVKGGRFICKCDCGNMTKVVPKNLLDGAIKSCGCLSIENSTTHGESKTRLYGILNGMKQRCYNPNTENYDDYGGRGITVCDEWLEDYTIFRDWAMNNGYSEELSIDRIDNDKGYFPENCRWATDSIQNSNRRPNKKPRNKILWKINGETKPMTEWCEQYGLSYQTVKYRIDKIGLAPYEALTMDKSRPTKEPK